MARGTFERQTPDIDVSLRLARIIQNVQAGMPEGVMRVTPDLAEASVIGYPDTPQYLIRVEGYSGGNVIVVFRNGTFDGPSDMPSEVMAQVVAETRDLLRRFEAQPAEPEAVPDLHLICEPPGERTGKSGKNKSTRRFPLPK